MKIPLYNSNTIIDVDITEEKLQYLKSISLTIEQFKTRVADYHYEVCAEKKDKSDKEALDKFVISVLASNKDKPN